MTSALQVTYRVIHVADGQMETRADGTAAVSVVTGFPAATQTGTPPVTRVTGSVLVVLGDFSLKMKYCSNASHTVTGYFLITR